MCPDGVDVVLDSQGGEECNRGYTLLKPLGRYILFGMLTWMGAAGVGGSMHRNIKFCLILIVLIIHDFLSTFSYIAGSSSIVTGETKSILSVVKSVSLIFASMES